MHPNESLTTFTLAAALGVCLFTVATYLRTSPIVVLLLGGVIVGPEGLGLVHPDSLGEGLGTIISLAVAIILFEGGLTLDLNGYRSVSQEIWRVLTIGVFVTWIGTTALLRLIFGFDIVFCVLAASLVIVTGPTVIGPLLHRIRVQAKLHHILHWEGVLIDPIGVFLALLSFEFFVSTDGTSQLVIKDLLLRFAVGVVLGIAFGFVLDWVLRRDWIGKPHLNTFVLAMAMLNFALADMAISESGLLSVTVAGLVLGSRNAPPLRDIVRYKMALKDFSIGLLFVLLAANLDLAAFVRYGWHLVLAVAGIMLIVRPLNIFVSMRRSLLTWKEKLFLGWIAPRGIVAASMASVFALELGRRGVENAVFLESFTYSVIAGTVVVQGITAGSVGRWLGVVRPVPTGWIIVGAHALGRCIATFFTRHGIDVVLIDTNAREVRDAEREGLIAINEDAMQLNPQKHAELYRCGNLLALTANADLNRMLCRRWAELLEDATLFRWEKSGYQTAENEHLLVGKRVWTELPLSRWMHPNSESPPLQVERRETNAGPETGNVLMTARGNQVIPGNPHELHKEDVEWLVYDGSGEQDSCVLPLTAENVIFSEQTDLHELYREMLHHLHQQLPGIDPEQMLVEIWRREEDYTSLLGHGIALPHTWSPAVDRATLMVARPRHQLLCPLTDLPIEIVFMLLSPVGEPDEHLACLSHIARLIGTESQRQRILDAGDAEQLHRLIACS
ncbi:cation:proton antiporter domain-containing protein [Rhodopirellula sp. JC639]|uniref:cation:proton antiporter domain-containing protein n=1 Tax=Stieleria mannarensis TaxID=2755585 RepID=UPI0015FF674E|nr:cation:proton antiporter [Rhodopirellula sp. JC639]